MKEWPRLAPVVIVRLHTTFESTGVPMRTLGEHNAESAEDYDKERMNDQLSGHDDQLTA